MARRPKWKSCRHSRRPTLPTEPEVEIDDIENEEISLRALEYYLANRDRLSQLEKVEGSKSLNLREDDDIIEIDWTREDTNGE